MSRHQLSSRQKTYTCKPGYPPYQRRHERHPEQSDLFSPGKDPTVDVYPAKAKDRPVVAQWQQRMGSDEAKALYKDRAATAEWVSALARNPRPEVLTGSRAEESSQGVALLFALAHKRMRATTLAPD